MTTKPAEPRSWLECPSCGERAAPQHQDFRCACGDLFDVLHRAPDPMGEALRRKFATPMPATAEARSGVWRYRTMVLPDAHLDEVLSWPEGNTPLVTRTAVSRWAGVEDLHLKHEGLNPTGSFKDRGMTVAVTQAVRSGAVAVACASTGNTAASLAAYAAHAGLPALVLLPAGRVASGKLGQAVACGARVVAVEGDFDTCLRLLEEARERLGVSLLNSVNPFRIEGQKSIVLELLEQLAWLPPEWIVLPAGNLGNTAAFGKALREARAMGLIRSIPRLAAIQAAGAAPFAQAFHEGFTARRSVHAETVATAIRIGSPASWERAVRAIRETDGVVHAVTDAAILEAKRAVDLSGVGCEPASAAAVAGVRELRRVGMIRPGDRVVAVLTGHLLKDPLTGHDERSPAPVPPTLEAVERVLAPASR